MLVNNEVDERKHIITATRGAARYLKRNNYFLKNWVFTLLSYNTGLGGCKNIINQGDIGAEKMDIDGKTHWYIIKFLAHKLTFQEIIGKQTQPSLTLLQYVDCQGKTLHDISNDTEIPIEDLELYNKWLRKKRVPEDKDYIVIIPAPVERAQVLMARLNMPSQIEPETDEVKEVEPVLAYESKLNTAFPVLKQKSTRNKAGKNIIFYTINGKPGVQAQPGDNITRLAEKSNISREKFIKYNDLKSNESLIPGEIYYLRKKKNKAKVHKHIVTEGETLWQISQKYGITMQALLRKNRMKRPEKLKHGRVVWLRYIRPVSEPVEIKDIPKPPVIVASKAKNEKIKEPIPSKKPTVKPKEKDIQIAEQKKTPVKITSTSEPEKQIAQSPAKNEELVVEEDTNTISIQEIQPVYENIAGSTNSSQTHLVTTGQTLFAIAKLYKVTVDDLRIWNNLLQSDGIKVGQNLVIRKESLIHETTAEVNEFTEYIVQTGDTLYKIAREHSVSVQDLATWNNKTDYGVAVGERLKIKSGK
jgi:membrane-bound lytic murein transglycosylase D